MFWGKINHLDYLADSRWNYEDITYILDPQIIEKMKHDILGNSGKVGNDSSCLCLNMRLPALLKTKKTKEFHKKGLHVY